MIRGSTPSFTLSLPAAPSLFATVEAVFVQEGRELLRRQRDEMTCHEEAKAVSFLLSEAETLRFSADSTAELQLRLVTHDGKILLSHPKRLAIGRRLPEDAE